MTVEFFQVLEHYAVRTELHAQRDVLLIPYEVPDALWEDLPLVETFTPREEMRKLRLRLADAGSDVISRLDVTDETGWGGQ